MSYYFQGFPTIKYDINGDGRLADATDIFRSVRIKPSMRDNIMLYTSYTIQDGERPDHVSIKLYNSIDYYWTFFMINEDLVNIFTDWPLSTLELHNLIARKYSGFVLTSDNDFAGKFQKNERIFGLLSGATATLLEKDINTGILKIGDIVGEFADGELIEGLTSKDILTIGGQRPFKDVAHHYEDVNGNTVGRFQTGAYPITNEEWEYAVNEKKSVIQVIKPQHISKVAQEFFNQINPEQE